MIKVDLDHSWWLLIKIPLQTNRRTDKQTDGRTTLSLESLSRLKIIIKLLLCLGMYYFTIFPRIELMDETQSINVSRYWAEVKVSHQLIRLNSTFSIPSSFTILSNNFICFQFPVNIQSNTKLTYSAQCYNLDSNKVRCIVQGDQKCFWDVYLLLTL